MNASGIFEVSLTPHTFHAQGVDGTQLARMTIDKTFSGDMVGKSVGEMLSAMTATPGSAGYVALEQVVVTLSNKKGSFVLQHFGTMNKGTDQLILEVVPDSGANELAGIVGTMTIEIKEKIHHYSFEYEFDSKNN